MDEKLVEYMQQYYHWIPHKGDRQCDYTCRGLSHEDGIIPLVLKLYGEGVRGWKTFRYEFVNKSSYTWLMRVEIEEFAHRVLEYAI